MHESMDAETRALTGWMFQKHPGLIELTFLIHTICILNNKLTGFLGLLGFMYHIPFRTTFAVLTLFESN